MVRVRVRRSFVLRVVAAGSAFVLLPLLLAYGAPATAATATSAAASGKPPIVVCQVSAQSGPDTAVGIPDVQGVKAFADYVNAHGGTLGRRWTVVVQDDASDPSTAIAEVRKCITQIHANFILGPGETLDFVAAIPVADAMHTVLITQGAGWQSLSPPLTSAELHSYAFPGLYDAYQQFDRDAISGLIVPRHYTRVAVIEGSEEDANATCSYVKSFAKRDHFKVVACQLVQENQTDDTPEVLNLLAAKPQIIVQGIPPGADTVTFIKALRAQNQTIPLAACPLCELPSFPAAVGGLSALNNVYVVGSVLDLLNSLPDTPANRHTITTIKTYTAALKAAGYGTPDDVESDLVGWESAAVLANAIETAKSTSEDAVKAALGHQHFSDVGITWARSPSDYAGLGQVQQALLTWGADGKLHIYRT
jgi:branched-chain amino acid transport system substrate-binding protein